MIETAMLRVSTIVSEGLSDVKTKTAGITMAAVARNKVEALVFAAVVLNTCSSFPSPPKKKAIPRIKSRFPMIEPVIEAFTISVRPACRAKMLIISSVAFPKVAFNKPPRAGPVCVESSSVDSPIYLASGIIARDAKIKIAMGEKCVYSANRLNGTKIRRTLKKFSSILVFSIRADPLITLFKVLINGNFK